MFILPQAVPLLDGHRYRHASLQTRNGCGDVQGVDTGRCGCTLGRRWRRSRFTSATYRRAAGYGHLQDNAQRKSEADDEEGANHPFSLSEADKGAWQECRKRDAGSLPATEW